MKSTLLILGIFAGGFTGITATQAHQNRTVEKKCNLETHKIVYVKNAVLDQAFCIRPEHEVFIPAS